MPEDNKAIKWYYKPVWIVVAILAAGPFALPLVFLSPVLKKWQKAVLTMAVLLITAWFIKAAVEIYQSLIKQLDDIKSIMQ